MAKVYLVNDKTKRRYEVVKIDKEKGTITLRGETTTFTENYDKEYFKELGYRPVTVEETEDA